MAVKDDVQVFADYLLVRSTGAVDTGAAVLERVRKIVDLARSAERDMLLIDDRGLRYGAIAEMIVPVYEVAKTLPGDEAAMRLRRVAVIAPAGQEPLVQYV